MHCNFASLNEQNLSAINAYEQKTGRTLIAYSCKDIKVEDMNDSDVAELKKLEDELCLQLVAVK